MNTPPSGTVTFLFTDIEGSTKLWEHYPNAMKTALARHDALLREAIEKNHGYVFKTVGDAFCAAFPTALDGMNAALAAQRGLQTEPWGESRIKARMGLHTGSVEEREGDYFGRALNRVARLFSSGHGGQTLLSLATAELLRDHLPEGVSLRDLGERRLKDLERPERIYQVLAPDLPTDFPPLKTLDSLPNNLPIQLTSFIGRETEIAEVNGLLTKTRLLTLTGTGGCGKTRLALQVAADQLGTEGFAEGVWFVELAAIADPALVPQTIASAFGLREAEKRPMLEILSDYLRAKRLLLVLDNCEHLIDDCAHLADQLLRACPDLRLIATSREALGISGELAWRVPSLSLPDPKQTTTIESVMPYEAVKLFIDRAVFALPTFTVTNANAPAVAQICYRLDGIPLAIELAASRVKALRVEQIAVRLDDRFRLLTGGSRTALPRQQTLRALVDWSYDLLSEQERVLLRRLSVFAGGFTLEAAESVCGTQHAEGKAGTRALADHLLPADVLDLLTRLVDRSLVVFEERRGETRYRLMETIRQFARDKLLESGETNEVRDHHLEFFIQLAEQAEPRLQTREQKTWLNRLEMEHDNLRAALQWSSEGTRAIEAALRLSAALWMFWYLRGYFAEGREWLEKAIAQSSAEQPSLMSARAKALCRAGWLAFYQGDTMRANELADIALPVCRQVGDKWEIAFSLELMVTRAMRRDWGRAEALIQESLALFRELGPAGKWGYGDALSFMAWIALGQNDHKRATELFEEDLAICRELGDSNGIAHLLGDLGIVAQAQGDYLRAEKNFQESVNIAHEVGARLEIARSLLQWSKTARAQGHYDQAHRLVMESVALYREIGHRSRLASALEEQGIIAWRQGKHPQAIEWLSESIAIRREAKQPLVYPQLCLGDVFRSQGDYQRAWTLYIQALTWERDHRKDQEMIAESLRRFAAHAQAQTQADRVVRLMSAAKAIREATGGSHSPVDRADDERVIAIARAQLDEVAFTVAWEEGKKMTLEQAVEYALEQSND